MADILQSSLIGSTRGGIGNIDWTIPNAAFQQLPFNKPYVSIDATSIQAQILSRNINYSQQVFSVKAKSLRYYYRPFFSLTDDFALSVTQLEGQSDAVYIYNNNSGQCVTLAPSVEVYENLFAGGAWKGVDVRSLVIQGCVPFEVDFNDNLDLTYVASVIVPLTAMVTRGKLRLQFLEPDMPSWNNSVIASLVSVP